MEGDPFGGPSINPKETPWRVRDAFANNLANEGELGGGVCIRLEGRTVVPSATSDTGGSSGSRIRRRASSSRS